MKTITKAFCLKLKGYYEKILQNHSKYLNNNVKNTSQAKWHRRLIDRKVENLMQWIFKIDKNITPNENVLIRRGIFN